MLFLIFFGGEPLSLGTYNWLKNKVLWLSCFCFFGNATWHAGSYFPDQGSNLCPPAVEAWSLNHWTTGEVLENFFWKNRSPSSCLGSKTIWSLPVLLFLGSPTRISRLGVPKTTLRFDDLLEGLTKLRKLVYYSERMQIKISKEEKGIGWSSGESGHKLLVLLFLGNHMDSA